jgi:orotate phosphoribosyltransferase
MVQSKKNVAEFLLQIKAIKLEPANPFTWSSGWLSPIYCDNRKTLSFPEVREYIRDRFVEEIQANYPGVEVIAGVATGAIAHGALVAEKMGLPFIYIRSSKKGHGLENLIEGQLVKGQKVVVVEDLISTGRSSLNAVEAVRQAGGGVMGLVAIFSYGFKQAEDNFKQASCPFSTLDDYDSMIKIAAESGYVRNEDLNTLKSWREDPENWGK